MITTKRIYEPAGDDGVRVLVMRLWPRGIRKDQISVWLKELGPSAPLLKAFKSGWISWKQFRPRYLAGLKSQYSQQQLETLRALAGKEDVTLLCACEDEKHCHRTLLKKFLVR